ncbi:hypothetical protein AA0Z99_09345 [Agrococcus sp. 1P02AA]|uniref:hypothetical protein n=1 Tax=Agrococcus sp. 1P02AA TaxID=3132259 RepID=UPI0039A5E8E7
MAPEVSRERAARTAALWTLAAGFLATALLALVPAGWLQGRLRFGCVLEAGDWVCDGSAALVAAGVSSAGLGGLALGAVALIVRATWDRARLRAERFGFIALIAVLPSLIMCAWLLVDAIIGDAVGVAHDDSRVAMWAERAMIAALITATAGMLAGSALRMRAGGRPRRAAFVALAAALALLLVAAAASALGTLPTGVAAAAAIIAGWRIAAGAWPARAR